MYFIEETALDAYNVLWRGNDPREALNALRSLPMGNRLELWTKAHAASPKGFAPLAFRDKNSLKVMTSHTFEFLHLNLQNS